MPGGRPTKYTKAHATQARKLCENGATDVDLADIFGVSIATITKWKAAHPEFVAALKGGKEATDDRVQRSLYERAVGYTYDAVKIFMPAGAKNPVYAPYREHVPPDPTSMIFWLKNRRREEWRDSSSLEHSGPGGTPLAIRVDRADEGSV